MRCVQRRPRVLPDLSRADRQRHAVAIAPAQHACAEGGSTWRARCMRRPRGGLALAASGSCGPVRRWQHVGVWKQSRPRARAAPALGSRPIHQQRPHGAHRRAHAPGQQGAACRLAPGRKHNPVHTSIRPPGAAAPGRPGKRAQRARQGKPVAWPGCSLAARGPGPRGAARRSLFYAARPPKQRASRAQHSHTDERHRKTILPKQLLEQGTRRPPRASANYAKTHETRHQATKPSPLASHDNK